MKNPFVWRRPRHAVIAAAVLLRADRETARCYTSCCLNSSGTTFRWSYRRCIWSRRSSAVRTRSASGRVRPDVGRRGADQLGLARWRSRQVERGCSGRLPTEPVLAADRHVERDRRPRSRLDSHLNAAERTGRGSDRAARPVAADVATDDARLCIGVLGFERGDPERGIAGAADGRVRPTNTSNHHRNERRCGPIRNHSGTTHSPRADVNERACVSKLKVSRATCYVDGRFLRCDGATSVATPSRLAGRARR